MAKYRKKPVVVEAVQFTGDVDAVIRWAQELGKDPTDRPISPHGGYCLRIATLEGDHIASPGDFIIRGVAGEFYPCKPDIFEATYERVEVE